MGLGMTPWRRARERRSVAEIPCYRSFLFFLGRFRWFYCIFPLWNQTLVSEFPDIREQGISGAEQGICLAGTGNFGVAGCGRRWGRMR